MTTSDDARRAQEADAILDLVAAVEATRQGRPDDVRFLLAGRSDPVFHDLLVSAVARAVAAARRPLPPFLGTLSAHTWTELRHRAAQHAGGSDVAAHRRHLPRHAADATPASVEPVPVRDRNTELVRAFAALLDADDEVCGQGYGAGILATAREMALRSVLPASPA